VIIVDKAKTEQLKKTIVNESVKKKRYYWLKLNEGFFDQPVIKKLRKIAGGDTYTCIYLKMMLMSVKTEGVLIYEGLEETLEKELALKLDEDATNIKVVISYLFSHHLMIEESKKNRSYLMSEVPKMTGKEGDSAERVRAHRERKNALALQCNDDVTRGNFPPLHCNTTVTSDEKNDALLHCNSLVTTCNDDVTRCNDDVTENFKKSEKFHFLQ
jgi:predicted phage replisome organizer